MNVSEVRAPTLSRPPTSIANLRVLVVEDNRADARFLEEMLADSRNPTFECVCVEDLATARAAVTAATFDAILLDLSLPDGSGIETVHKMRDIAPRTPCIVLTGTRDERLAVHAVQAGAQDYVEKGSEGARLLARTICYAIERRKAEDEAVARAQAEENARQARLLADATRAMNESLDLGHTLRAIARVAVPALGDFGWIDLIEGEFIVRVACEHRDPSMREQLQAAASFAPRRDSKHPSVLAIDRGVTLVYDCREEELRRRFVQSEEHRAWIEQMGPRHALIVPLRVREQSIGALVLVRARDERSFTESDVALGEDLATRAAFAVENARVHRNAMNAALAREEMIAVVSHDLRNPLSVVALTLRRLRGMPEVLQRAGTDTFDRAERALQRSTRLLDDLLEIARIDAGALDLKCADVWAAELLTDAIDLHRPIAENKKIALGLACDEDLPALFVDRHRIAQVLANLLGNALKFTPEGGSVSATATRANNEVRFCVSDDGPGIPRDALPRLFDRFYRTPDAKQPGTGLGLAIAKGIVQAHGGRIWAESTVGAGTRMFFQLPAR